MLQCLCSADAACWVEGHHAGQQIECILPRLLHSILGLNTTFTGSICSYDGRIVLICLLQDAMMLFFAFREVLDGESMKECQLYSEDCHLWVTSQMILVVL